MARSNRLRMPLPKPLNNSQIRSSTSIAHPKKRFSRPENSSQGTHSEG
jgi:hypothetical protein